MIVHDGGRQLFRGSYFHLANNMAMIKRKISMRPKTKVPEEELVRYSDIKSRWIDAVSSYQTCDSF